MRRSCPDARVTPSGTILPAVAVLAVAGVPFTSSGAASPDPMNFAEGAPPGHTGGFGEPTCLACHDQYPLNPDGGSVRVEGFPAEWGPGETYALTVVLRSSEMAKAGFQLAIRHRDGSRAGSLSPLDPRVQVEDSAGVHYAHQTAAGSDARSPEAVSWMVEWRAPAEGETLRLDVAANSANGDNSPFGDLVYQATQRARRRR